MGSFKVAFDTRKPHLNQIKAKIVDMRRVLEQISVKWLKYVLLEAFLGPFGGPKTMFLKIIFLNIAKIVIILKTAHTGIKHTSLSKKKIAL